VKRCDFLCFRVYQAVQKHQLDERKQGVALTGRNTTGPPHAAHWWVTSHMRRVTDDDKRQTTTDASDRY